MTDLKLGDIVCLRGMPSLRLTVVAVGMKADAVEVAWFNGNNGYETRTVPVAALEKCK